MRSSPTRRARDKFCSFPTTRVHDSFVVARPARSALRVLLCVFTRGRRRRWNRNGRRLVRWGGDDWRRGDDGSGGDVRRRRRRNGRGGIRGSGHDWRDGRRRGDRRRGSDRLRRDDGRGRIDGGARWDDRHGRARRRRRDQLRRDRGRRRHERHRGDDRLGRRSHERLHRYRDQHAREHAHGQRGHRAGRRQQRHLRPADGAPRQELERRHLRRHQLDHPEHERDAQRRHRRVQGSGRRDDRVARRVRGRQLQLELEQEPEQRRRHGSLHAALLAARDPADDRRAGDVRGRREQPGLGPVHQQQHEPHRTGRSITSRSATRSGAAAAIRTRRRTRRTTSRTTRCSRRPSTGRS